jgi:hypothetical protein
VLPHRGQARHVHPVAGCSVAQVVAIVLDGAERDAAESVDLENELAGRWSGRGDYHYVCFFAHADAVTDAE